MFMNEIELINDKFNLVVTEMPEKKKLYHLRSVYNFIVHFDEINEVESKAMVIHLLSEYLDYVYSNEIKSASEAKRLFNEYIYPIGIIYKKEAGFTYFFRPQSILVYLAALNITFLVLKSSIYIFVLLNLVGVIVFAIMHKKSYSTRIFRFDW